MNPDAACQSFELRRFPDLKDPLFRGLCIYVILVAFNHWLLALAIMGLVLVYVFWRLRRPVDCLRLSDAEICIKVGLTRLIQINQHQVEEVSPTSKGVVIAWKKSGVPRYTEVRSSWFNEDVWRKAYPALLAWGAPKQ